MTVKSACRISPLIPNSNPMFVFRIKAHRFFSPLPLPLCSLLLCFWGCPCVRMVEHRSPPRHSTQGRFPTLRAFFELVCLSLKFVYKFFLRNCGQSWCFGNVHRLTPTSTSSGLAISAKFSLFRVKSSFMSVFRDRLILTNSYNIVIFDIRSLIFDICSLIFDIWYLLIMLPIYPFHTNKPGFYEII